MKTCALLFRKGMPYLVTALEIVRIYTGMAYLQLFQNFFIQTYELLPYCFIAELSRCIAAD